MKKLFYAAIILGLMTTTFASCNDNDETPIEPEVPIEKPVEDTIEKFDGKIEATVQSEYYFDKIKANIKRVDAVLMNDVCNASTTLNDDKFSLFLNPVAHEDLENLVDENEMWPDSITISDKTTKFTTASFEFSGDTTLVYDDSRSFIHGKVTANSNVTNVEYIYVNKPVTITGTHKESGEYGGEGIYTYEVTYDIKLDTGWNRIYVTKVETISYTAEYTTFHFKGTATTKPISGLKWYLERDFEDFIYYSPGKTNVAAKSQAVFQNLRKRGIFFGK